MKVFFLDKVGYFTDKILLNLLVLQKVISFDRIEDKSVFRNTILSAD